MTTILIIALGASIPCIHLYWMAKYRKYTKEITKYNSQLKKESNKKISAQPPQRLILDFEDDVLNLDLAEDGSYKLFSVH